VNLDRYSCVVDSPITKGSTIELINELIIAYLLLCGFNDRVAGELSGEFVQEITSKGFIYEAQRGKAND